MWYWWYCVYWWCALCLSHARCNDPYQYTVSLLNLLFISVFIKYNACNICIYMHAFLMNKIVYSQLLVDYKMHTYFFSVLTVSYLMQLLIWAQSNDKDQEKMATGGNDWIQIFLFHCIIIRNDTDVNSGNHLEWFDWSWAVLPPPQYICHGIGIDTAIPIVFKP